MRLCAWCRVEPVRDGQVYHSKRCRQTAWRLRQRRGSVVAAGVTGLRFAYADPPYPGLAAKYYRHEDSFAGEVDHAALVSRLEERHRSGELAGWALSTSAAALRQVLYLCPPGARVCPWVKPHGVSRRASGLANAWEALIVVGGRVKPPGVRDWLRALPARGGGTLPGRKPIAFCAWLFDLLGMQPGDELDDLFPGSGVVARSWEALTAAERQEELPLPRASETEAA